MHIDRALTSAADLRARSLHQITASPRRRVHISTAAPDAYCITVVLRVHAGASFFYYARNESEARVAAEAERGRGEGAAVSSSGQCDGRINFYDAPVAPAPLLAVDWCLIRLARDAAIK